MYVMGEYPDYSTQQWDSTKDTLELEEPNLPYFIDFDNEARITDTLEIMKYISAKYRPEMLGRTVDDQDKVEQIAQQLMQFKKEAYDPCYYKHTVKN